MGAERRRRPRSLGHYARQGEKPADQGGTAPADLPRCVAIDKFLSRFRRADGALERDQLHGWVGRLASDAKLFLDLERFPTGTEISQHDTSQLLARLNDIVERESSPFIEVEILVCWLDASRARSLGFYAEFRQLSPWRRAVTVRDGGLDRILAGVRTTLNFVMMFNPDLHNVVEEAVVEAASGDVVEAMAFAQEHDEEGFMHTAIRDISERSIGEPGNRLEARRPDDERR